MTKQDYQLIATSIWRSGYVKDPNKVRQAARQKIRQLIATDLATSLTKTNSLFDREKFMQACGF